MTLSVIYEDNHLLVVDKPAGLLSQGDISGDTNVLDEAREYVKVTRNKPGNVFLGLVHRLDRPVSGVMVLALTSKAAGRLQKQFAGREVRKFYLARVEKASASPGREWVTLEDRLIREGDRTRPAGDREKGGQKAVLRYLPAGHESDLFLVELMTGRKHQIRAQLASRGMPVQGDARYGGREMERTGICLHSLALRLTHPTRPDNLVFYSSPPGYICHDSNLLHEIRSTVTGELMREKGDLFYT